MQLFFAFFLTYENRYFLVALGGKTLDVFRAKGSVRTAGISCESGIFPKFNWAG